MNRAFPEGRPVEAGKCFLLLPDGSSPAQNHTENTERVPIHLSRGRAFGSGLHETTMSCIEAMESLAPLEARSVLDVGTGTGVLSLAALFLGARSAVAFDIDMEAALTCGRNAILNKMNGRLGVFTGTLDALDSDSAFDLVLANIHGDIILEKAHRLAGHTLQGGHLVLSGLDYSDNRPVKTAMKGFGMEEVSVRFLQDFVTQVWFHPRTAERTAP